MRLSGHARKQALRSTEPDFWLIKPPEFHRVTSQGIQDGALEYIFHHIGTTNKYYVVRNTCTSRRCLEVVTCVCEVHVTLFIQVWPFRSRALFKAVSQTL